MKTQLISSYESSNKNEFTTIILIWLSQNQNQKNHFLIVTSENDPQLKHRTLYDRKSCYDSMLWL